MLFIWLALVNGLTNWPILSVDTAVAIRTQRDISYEVPINQITDYGVSLGSVLFDTQGYTLSSLAFVSSFLSTGIGNIVIDLYWNNLTHVWQLCPAPFPVNMTDPSQTVTINWQGHQYDCSPELTTDDIMQSISSYLDDTNTNMAVNFIKLLYRLNRLDIPVNSTMLFEKSSPYGNSSLSDTINKLGSVSFGPTDLQTYQSSLDTSRWPRTFYNSSDSGFPNLKTFFYTNVKRIMTMVVYDDVTPYKLYNYTTNDKNTIFVDEKSVNVTVESLNSSSVGECLSHVFNLSSVDPEIFKDLATTNEFRYVYEQDDMQFNDVTYRSLIRCGFIPLINSSDRISDADDIGSTMDHFIPFSYWSWSSNLTQALEGSEGSNANITARDTKEEDEDSVNHVANNCVAVFGQGWKVENCYKTLPFACQNDENPLEWKISEDSKSYFDAYKDSSCPQGFKLGVPKSSIEMLALFSQIADDSTPFPLWIDVNDITVNGCFVTGGPYATCAYQQTVSNRALAGLIAPSFVTIVVLVGLFILEKIWRVNPIQTERKRYWKRKIDEINKEVYEGVPS